MIKQIRNKIFDIVSAARSTETEKRISFGRNDLCRCGSGKKYKRCHLKPEDDISFHENVLLSYAALIPIISTWLGTQIMYWSGNSGNSLWTWAQFAINVTIGVVCIVKMSSLSKTKRALIVLAYLPIIYVIVSGVGLITACFNGDCL